MTEADYTRAVHKRLPACVYRWKIADRFTAGIPDAYYSNSSDLWVEYKYIKSVPAKKLIIPALSALQRKWLTDRKTEGRNVAVIVGTPQGAVISTNQLEWVQGIPCLEFLHRKDVAAWIADQVTRPFDDHRTH